jgi:Nuclease-related domain
MAVNLSGSLRDRDRGQIRGLGLVLDHLLRGTGAVLHDRRFARNIEPIDHLVIAPSGLWVIDALYDPYTIQRRHLGPVFRTRPHLFVDGRERSAELEAMNRRVDILRGLIALVGYHDTKINAVMCFVTAPVPISDRHRMFSGVLVTDPVGLSDRLREPGRLSQAGVMSVTYHMDSLLPPVVTVDN